MKKQQYLTYGFRVCYITFFALVLAHVVSALTLDRRIQYKEVSYASPAVPPALDGYVIAFVTDTHDMPLPKLEQAVARINARQADLLLLGGDYPDGNAGPTMEILGRVAAKDGIYGVDGNHDNWRDLAAAMGGHGMTLLDNDGGEIRSGLYLAVVTFGSDVREVWPDVKSALRDAPPNDFALLLMHNPDVSMLQNTAAADLMLAGHTHGGEITFFGLWAPGLKGITLYGHKFKGGWAVTDKGGDIFTSRGLGSSHNRLRIFARPQVIFLTLRAS